MPRGARAGLCSGPGRANIGPPRCAAAAAARSRFLTINIISSGDELAASGGAGAAGVDRADDNETIGATPLSSTLAAAAAVALLRVKDSRVDERR